MRLLSVLGTRPEAVKMAPVLAALRAERVEVGLCVTGQHRELLDEVLAFFGVVPDFDLDLMEPAQALNRLAARAVGAIDNVLEATRPDRLIVQGDTTTALAAALAAFHRNIPVAHVEAGLRTYAPRSPWPEEVNRRAIALIADVHFAPTAAARDNLCAERLNGQVFVTGNSGVDALRGVTARLDADPELRRSIDRALPADGRKLILVTAHRRESLGAPFRAICAALEAIARRGDAAIVYPLHPNPAVSGPARQALGHCANVHLLPPLDLASFVRLMQRSDLVLTDSGGVQEEAVALGRPVLVMRDVTERSEAVAAGAARLLGTRKDRIVRQIEQILNGRRARFAPAPALYGDGQAAARIVDGLLGRPVEEFAAAGLPRAPARVTAAAE